MKRRVIAASLPTLACLATAGCGAPGGGPVASGGTAPYDFAANPYCGVYGNCTPPNPRGFHGTETQSSGF